MDDRWTHGDGRQCRELPYALDGFTGLLTGYFYWEQGLEDDPGALRLCHRDHGLTDDDD